MSNLVSMEESFVHAILLPMQKDYLAQELGAIGCSTCKQPKGDYCAPSGIFQ